MAERDRNLYIDDTALVLIDFQRDVVGEMDSKIRQTLERRNVIANAASVADRCRSLGVPVIFVRVERDAQLRDQTDKWTQFLVTGRGRHQTETFRTIPGTDGYQFAEDIPPHPNDIIITKHRVSAFFGTPLDTYLKAMKIRNILIGGVYTHRGVESTIRDAWDLDYNAVALHDCCGAYPMLMHEHAVTQIFTEFARVMSGNEAIQSLVRRAT